MADIHIRRDHLLGLTKARKIAWQWAEQVESEFDMACTYAEGPDGDEVTFKRTGVSGTLSVTPEYFELNARLGLLLGAFKDHIELEIVKNLDALLSKKKPAGRKGEAG